MFSRFSSMFVAMVIINLPVAPIAFVPTAAAEEKPGTISISGTGTVKAAPDTAIVSVGVVKEAKTAREALDQNNKAMAQVLEEMEKAGIEPRDLQTSGFNISPRYVYPKNNNNGQQRAPKIAGYTVSNNLTIRIRKIDQTGALLDKLVSLGINTGGNIQFVNDDTTKLLREARKRAVEDAKQRAETILTAAGGTLGRIQSISENSQRPSPRPIARAQSLAVEAADSVPIASGENSYRVIVNIVWEIAQ